MTSAQQLPLFPEHEQLAKLKEDLDALRKELDSRPVVCPSCSKCPTCGRSARDYFPRDVWPPYQPNPRQPTITWDHTDPFKVMPGIVYCGHSSDTGTYGRRVQQTEQAAEQCAHGRDASTCQHLK